MSGSVEFQGTGPGTTDFLASKTIPSVYLYYQSLIGRQFFCLSGWSLYYAVSCDLGRVLLGLFRNRNTRNIRYLCSFGSYSVFGMNGINYHSVHSAPGSRMNRMEEMRFTRNRQNACICSFGNFLAGNPTRPPTPVASAEVTSDSVSTS